MQNENMSTEEAAKMREVALNLENERKNSMSTNKNKNAKSEAMAAKTWRDLIPVIKIDICSGRFVFGNRLTPTTLSICVEEAKCVYSTKPAASRLDHFMHFLKAKVDNAKVLLAPSPKYTGLVDDPPRLVIFYKSIEQQSTFLFQFQSFSIIPVFHSFMQIYG